jgi:cyclase
MTRIIAKLDIKSKHVVKPVHFEGLRKICLPDETCSKYYAQGADEIFYVDIVASLYQRTFDLEQIKDSAKSVFIPFAVGGGVRNIDDFSKLFHAGADKVTINTYALQNDPEIIDKAAHIFGSQAVVVNIEAKKWDDWWECYTDCGRIRTGKSVADWASEVQERGAGEILLQSVDCDGRRRGYDKELLSSVIDNVSIPVVAASGAGSVQDVVDVVKECNPSGVAVSSILHYGTATIEDIKKALKENV